MNRNVVFGTQAGPHAGTWAALRRPVSAEAMGLLAAALAMGLLGPLGGAGLGLLVAAGVLVVMMPMALVALYAAVIVANVADVATKYHGLPPLGGLAVPLLAALLLARAVATGARLDRVMTAALVMGIYLLGRTLTLPRLEAPGPSWAALIELGKNLLIVVVFVGYLTSLARLRTVVAAMAMASAAMAALSVMQYATGTFHDNYGGFAVAALRQITVDTADGWRLTGPVWDANFFGQFLLVGLPLVALFALTGTSRVVKMAGLLGSLAMLAAIVLTFSRGAIFATLAVAVLGAVLVGGRRAALWLAGLGVAGLAVASLLVPHSYVERLLGAVQAIHASLVGGQWIGDPALQERLSVIGVALRMAATHPLFGIGIGQFAAQYPDYALRLGLDPGAPAEAHSLYLETLAEGGLFGLILLLAMAGGLLLLGLRVRGRLLTLGARRDAALVLAVVLSTSGFLATSIFLHGAHQRLFWLDAALLLSAWTATRARRPVPALRFDRPDPTPPRGAGGLPQLVLLLWKGRALVLLCTLLGLGAGWLDLQRHPRAYAAQESLLYRFGRDYFPVTPGEARRNWGENVTLSLDNALFTEMQLLQAHRLLERAADVVWPPAQRKVDANGHIPTTQDLADRLAARLQVTRVQGASMIRVTARDADPAVADRAVRAQVAAYLAERQRLFDGGAQGFYDGRIADDLARLADLTRQQARISAMPETGPSAATAREIALQPINAAMAEVRKDLSLLVQERAAAAVSNAYRRQVAPAVEVVDHRPAAGNPVGMSPVLRLTLAGMAGAVLGALIVMLASLLAGLAATAGQGVGQGAGQGMRPVRPGPEARLASVPAEDGQ